MKTINQHNYEAFYLDYLEGNLSPKLEVELLDFLNQNSHLKSDLDDLGELKLKQDKSMSLDVSFLKQTDFDLDAIHLNNVEDFIIAEMEHQLDERRKKELQQFISSHQLEKMALAYQSTSLKANSTDVFPNKNQLKQKTLVIKPWYYYASAVAAIFIVGWLTLFNSPSTNSVQMPKNNKQMALTSDTKNLNSDTQSENNTTDLVEENTVEAIMPKNNSTTKKTPIDVKSNGKIMNDDTSHTQTIIHPEDIPNSTLVAEENVSLDSSQTIVNEISDELIAIETHQPATPSTVSKNELKEPYKMITDIATNYTHMDMSYKESTSDNEYQITSISLGKFSFERKKRK